MRILREGGTSIASLCVVSHDSRIKRFVVNQRKLNGVAGNVASAFRILSFFEDQIHYTFICIWYSASLNWSYEWMNGTISRSDSVIIMKIYRLWYYRRQRYMKKSVKNRLFFDVVAKSMEQLLSHTFDNWWLLLHCGMTNEHM